MTKIIGREQEIRLFKALLDSKDAGLFAIYGRRRIGKAFLVKEYFKDKGSLL